MKIAYRLRRLLELVESMRGDVASVSAYESGDIYLTVKIDGVTYNLNLYKDKEGDHEADK